MKLKYNKIKNKINKFFIKLQKNLLLKIFNFIIYLKIL